MNVEKLFPSLVAVEVARVVKEEFLAATLEIEVDNVKLGLHLAVTMKREDLVRMGLGEVTHTRISAGGSSPGINTWKRRRRSTPEICMWSNRIK